MTQPKLKDVNPEHPHLPLGEVERAEIEALARRQRQAGGVLMKAVNLVGNSVEDGLRVLPKPVRARIDKVAQAALLRSYDAAARTRTGEGRLGPWTALVTGDRAHKALAAVSGALGGAGGLTTALAELPLATTIIFRAVQGVAEAHGEDPALEETRVECLRVFGAGGAAVQGDEGIDTAFLGARLSLAGTGINRLVARVAPRFGAVVGQKLASQAVPILGAAAGAGTNWAFIDYYVEMAHVHFGLRRLARTHGEDAVLDHFHKALVQMGPAVRTA
ncbi:EcsC family protein [Rubellimicrobium roseum]|uniref:Protein EcsC n=1 Tax=Rubellimicrobium roseum TaxID=687525 RepID=A0A5C4NDQ9_9RHOB|nr:EcsC family protein [Rubellimicrobium roseum]TNC70967.1 protein EcsC [Rubellimicrobium roseum]